MRGFQMAVMGAVASAMVVVAVVALDAMGAASTDASGTGGDPLVAEFVSCLRDHGVAVPSLTGGELGLWLKTHELPDDAARACKTAMADNPPVTERSAKADAAKITACVRDQGFDPPTDPVALKRWIGEQRGPAIEDALKECGVGPAPKAGCGDEDKVAPPPARAKLHETRGTT
jgi:hypothetical protein